MIFHKQVRIRRKSMGLSLEDVADRIGVTRQAVSKWELGQMSPRPGHLDMLCLILQLEPPTEE